MKHKTLNRKKNGVNRKFEPERGKMIMGWRMTMGLGSKMVLKEKEKKRERKGKREKDGVC